MSINVNNINVNANNNLNCIMYIEKYKIENHAKWFQLIIGL